MPTTETQTCRFHPTPGHCLLVLLAVEFLLFLSQWFRWLPQGWPVLISVAAVALMMLGMVAWFGVAVLLRRRFQFSLRSLLVLVVVVALPSSWLAVEVKKAKEQRRSLELFTASAYIVYGDDITDGNGDFVGETATMELTRRLTGVNSQRPLVGLLGWDFFHNAAILAKWDLADPDKSDDPSFDDIDPRYARERQATQALLLVLKNLPDLQALALCDMPVTDSDLEHVVPLKQLRRLELRRTRVTNAGVAKLQQALSNCKITR